MIKCANISKDTVLDIYKKEGNTIPLKVPKVHAGFVLCTWHLLFPLIVMHFLTFCLPGILVHILKIRTQKHYRPLFPWPLEHMPLRFHSRNNCLLFCLYISPPDTKGHEYKNVIVFTFMAPESKWLLLSNCLD